MWSALGFSSQTVGVVAAGVDVEVAQPQPSASGASAAPAANAPATEDLSSIPTSSDASRSLNPIPCSTSSSPNARRCSEGDELLAKSPGRIRRSATSFVPTQRSGSPETVGPIVLPGDGVVRPGGISRDRSGRFSVSGKRLVIGPSSSEPSTCPAGSPSLGHEASLCNVGVSREASDESRAGAHSSSHTDSSAYPSRETSRAGSRRAARASTRRNMLARASSNSSMGSFNFSHGRLPYAALATEGTRGLRSAAQHTIALPRSMPRTRRAGCLPPRSPSRAPRDSMNRGHRH